MELTKFDMTRARRSSPSQTCCSFFFLCSLLRLCWGFLSGLLLPNSPSPTRSRLEQVILTIGNGLPLRPVLVLPTWPGMPHWVTHGVAMLSNEFIPVMTQGPIGKRLSRWLSEQEGLASLSSQWQTEEPYPIQCLLCDGGQVPVIVKVKAWRHNSCRFFQLRSSCKCKSEAEPLEMM